MDRSYQSYNTETCLGLKVKKKFTVLILKAALV